MIRNYTLILCSLFLSTASAQSWCPPGASWTHCNSFIGIYGPSHYYYVGDTTLGGMTGEKILRMDITFGWGPDPDTSIYISHITAQEDEVVFLWSNNQNAWDTLFWFGAMLGDQWSLPHSPYEYLLVTNIDTIEMDGVSLKKLDLLHFIDQNTSFPEEIIERIGSISSFAFSGGDGPIGLVAYHDSEISYSLSSDVCTITVGRFDAHKCPVLSPFPNPGTDHFTLQLPSGQHHLRIFDALGRSVLETTINSDQAVIDTRSLPSGAYHVHVTDQSGSIARSTWVKH